MKWLMTFCLLGLSIISLALAEEFSPQLQKQLSQSLRQHKALPSHLSKLQTALYQTWRRMNAAEFDRKTMTDIGAEYSNELVEVDTDGRLHVVLRVDAITPELLAELEQLGFEIESSTADLPISTNLHMIVGWIAFDQLEDVTLLPAVLHVRSSDKPRTNTGSVTSEGDGIHRASLLRNSSSINGTGQTVGVISDGVDHLANAQASGDLPANVNVLSNARGCIANNSDCTCPTGSANCQVVDEGTAMLEIVHDLAPSAALAFADAAFSTVQFAQRIVDLSNAGSSIIVDDISWFQSPVFEDGIIGQTINAVTQNNNVVYFSSAGNQGQSSYRAVFNDMDADGFHDFAPGDPGMDVAIAPGGTLLVFLQWNNKFGQSGEDYDLFLSDDTLSTLLASSVVAQTGSGDPLEIVGYTNPLANPSIVKVLVRRVTGSVREMSLVIQGPAAALEYVGPGFAVRGHQTAEHCLAVGAINASDPGNDDIASYSNHGPSRIYSYDNFGQPVSAVDRAKPNYAAIDGVSVTGAGGFGLESPPGSGQRLFFGTSAAAPHAAAIAALVRSSAPGLSAPQVAQILNSSAIDLGATGADNVFGQGRVDAFAAVQSACPSCLQSSSSTRLINLSTNGQVNGAEMAAGFIVLGNEARTFVILGERFNSNLDAFLRLTNVENTVVYESNDDWQTHPSANSVQALLRAPNQPLDAAFAVTLNPGVYVARLSGINGSSGTGIVAINEVSGSNNGTRLINLSTNGQISGAEMAAGFIVLGNEARTFVILGERFNSNLDAFLRLTNVENTVVYESNDDWQTHPSAGSVQALLRAPNQPLDAAFAVTLNPGVYVARLSGINGSSGTGIVAVNDVSP